MSSIRLLILPLRPNSDLQFSILVLLISTSSVLFLSQASFCPKVRYSFCHSFLIRSFESPSLFFTQFVLPPASLFTFIPLLETPSVRAGLILSLSLNSETASVLQSCSFFLSMSRSLILSLSSNSVSALFMSLSLSLSITLSV